MGCVSLLPITSKHRSLSFTAPSCLIATPHVYLIFLTRKISIQVALTNSSTSSKSPVLFVAFVSILCPLPQNVGSTCTMDLTGPWQCQWKELLTFNPLCAIGVLLTLFASNRHDNSRPLHQKYSMFFGVFQNASTNHFTVSFWFRGQPVSLCSGKKQIHDRDAGLTFGISLCFQLTVLNDLLWSMGAAGCDGTYVIKSFQCDLLVNWIKSWGFRNQQKKICNKRSCAELTLNNQTSELKANLVIKYNQVPIALTNSGPTRIIRKQNPAMSMDICRIHQFEVGKRCFIMNSNSNQSWKRHLGVLFNHNHWQNVMRHTLSLRPSQIQEQCHSAG